VTQEINPQDFNPEVAESLTRSGFKSEAYGCISMAGDQERAIHTLHMTRNALDKKDEKYQHKVMFLNASIEILNRERDKTIQKGLAAWQMSRKKGED
jgi:hypothetical protein